MSDAKAMQTQMEQEIKDAVERQKKSASTTAATITINKAGQFEVDGKTADGAIDVVIVDYIFSRGFWPKAWSPDSNEPPICAAVSDSPDSGVPHPDSPEIQSPEGTCETCANNEWNSGQGGRGKACKTYIWLAILPADNAKAEISLLRISPAGIKHFQKYMDSLSNVASFQMITNLAPVEAGSGHTARIDAGASRPLKDALPFFQRRQDAAKLLETRHPRWDDE